jgi:hypothetical protein
MSHTSAITQVFTQGEGEEIHRSVSLPNSDWLVLAQCAEAFSSTFRAQASQVVATYVTRGQLDLAVSEAAKMNILLQQLDSIHIALMS